MNGREAIGLMLVEATVLQPEHVDHVLAHARGERFCSAALRLGLATERSLVRVLGHQLGTPGMAIGGVEPAEAALGLLPAEAAHRFGALPVRAFSRSLTLAMRDPNDSAALADLQFFTGKVVRPVVALASVLEAALHRAYEQPPGSTSGLNVAALDESAERALADAMVVPVAALPVDALLPDMTPAPAADPDPQLLATLRADPVGLQREPTIEPAPSVPERDPRVPLLAVDDDAGILKLYEGMFDARRFNLHTCSRGDEALAAIHAHRPRVVLLDAMLPGTHGFEVCRQVKDTPALGQVRVVLLSAAYRGWQMKADLIRQYGADDFIEKPFDITVVMELVDRLLASPGERRRTRPLFADALRSLNQGLVHMQRGELALAAADFADAAEADPLAARPHVYLGKIHERQSAPYRAMHAYEQAVRLDPAFFPAMKDLAILYQSNGFLNKAVELWQKALAACTEESMRAAIREHLVRLL